ncbi:MAG: class I SAM-dependent methyltransferase [Cyanobacteria bacterium J06632_22]
MKEFDKYQRSGAYHWQQADASWQNSAFNLPLLSRYQALADRVNEDDEAILDAGCGDGYLLYAVHLRCPNSRLFGVDDNDLGVQLAQEKFIENNCPAKFQSASIYSLPFPDESFDVVLNADVIEHLDQPDAALQEMARVLKPNGRLLMSTPNRKPEGKWDIYHVKEFNASEIDDLCQKFFSNVRVSLCWPTWWLNQFLAGGFKRRAIHSLYRLFGYNPFLNSSEVASQDYAQLIVACTK